MADELPEEGELAQDPPVEEEPAKRALETEEADPPTKRARAETSDEAEIVVAAPTEEAAAAVEAPPAAECEVSEAIHTPATEVPAPAPAPAAPGNDELPPGSMGNDELVGLLQQRSAAKAARDFATSDSIRSQLEARGVQITDAKNASQVGRWVALDGREGNTQGPDFFQAVAQPHSGPTAAAPVYGQPAAAPPPSGGGGPVLISNDDLAEELRERAAAKVRKDYAKSDEIRSKLESLGIKIHDASKSWTSSDGRSGNLQGPDFFVAAQGAPGAYGAPYGGGYGGGYGGAAPDAGTPGSTAWISAKMVEREGVRSRRDFAQSDIMREELRSHGVHVDDRTKVWTHQDGRTGHVGGGGAPPPPTAHYGGAPYGHYPPYGAPAYGHYGSYPGGYGAPPPPPAYGGQPAYGAPPPPPPAPTQGYYQQ